MSNILNVFLISLGGILVYKALTYTTELGTLPVIKNHFYGNDHLAVTNQMPKSDTLTKKLDDNLHLGEQSNAYYEYSDFQMKELNGVHGVQFN